LVEKYITKCSAVRRCVVLLGSNIVPYSESFHPLCTEIEVRLATDGISETTLHAILDQLLATFGCAVGTLHSMDRDSGMLKLRAHRGLPEPLLARVQRIPIGKGMAVL